MKISKYKSLLYLLICTLYALSANAQTAPAEWKTQQNKLEEWVASIKTVKCYFSLSRYTTAQDRAIKENFWAEESRKNPKLLPWPNDSNYANSNFWVADQNRWRSDRYRLYPKTSLDFSQYIFDGEKYSFYDDYIQRAIITAQDTQPNSSDFVKSLRSNTWLGLGVGNLLDIYAATGFVTFKNTGATDVAGRAGYEFQSSNANGDLIICVDQETSVPLRLKEVYRVNPDDANIMIYQWSDIRLVNDIPVPFQCKLETYHEVKKSLSWEQTILFNIQDCKINVPLDAGFFENVLRVGTPVEDNLENPGRLSYVGGDLSDESRKVRTGIPPKLEEPNSKSTFVLSKAVTSPPANKP